MSNPQQNEIQSEVERVKKEIYCKKGLRKTKEARMNFIMNFLMRVRRIPVKKKTK